MNQIHTHIDFHACINLYTNLVYKKKIISFFAWRISSKIAA